MTAKLSKELTDALQASDSGHVEMIHPETGQVYFVVNGEIHQRAMEALRRQQDHDAIARGIEDMEAGRGRPLEEVDADIREEFGFPPRQAS
jgi:hypothetical protein